MMLQELERLDRLYRQGSLTDQEFTTAKALLLKQASTNSGNDGGSFGDLERDAALRQLDHQWEVESDQILKSHSNGGKLRTDREILAQTTASTFCLLIWIALTGAFSIFALRWLGPFGKYAILFPLFGCFALAVHWIQSAKESARLERYQVAYEEYLRRRQEVQTRFG